MALIGNFVGILTMAGPHAEVEGLEADDADYVGFVGELLQLELDRHRLFAVGVPREGNLVGLVGEAGLGEVEREAAIGVRRGLVGVELEDALGGELALALLVYLHADHRTNVVGRGEDVVHVEPKLRPEVAGAGLEGNERGGTLRDVTDAGNSIDERHVMRSPGVLGCGGGWTSAAG